MKMFPAAAYKPPAIPKPVLSAAYAREELSATVDSHETLLHNLAEAESQLNDAKNSFDVDAAQLLVPKVEAIHMVAQSHESKISSLRIVLADLELAEAIAAGSEQLPAIAAAARLQCDAFEKALKDVYAAETTMFALLFDPKIGLRQKFETPELMRGAAGVRIELRQRVMELARKYGAQINTRWETDGLQNLGPNGEPGFFHSIRRTIGNNF